jgi:hypothetical protein
MGHAPSGDAATELMQDPKTDGFDNSEEGKWWIIKNNNGDGEVDVEDKIEARRRL